MSKAFEMKSPTDLVGRLSYEYEDLPEGALFDALNYAGREIAKRQVLECVVDLTPRLQCGEDEYEFDDLIPEGLELSAVRFVRFCGCCIEPLDDKCDECSCGYRIVGNCTLKMQPAISSDLASQTLEICLSLRPKYGSCELPSVLCEQFAEQLIEYARSFIANMPNTRYSNFQEGRARARKANNESRSELARIQNNHRPGTRGRFGRRWLFQ